MARFDHRSPPIDTATYERVLLVARRLATTSDLDAVLGLIIDAMRDVLHAERASVFQYDAERHELFATRAHGLSSDIRLPADKGIVGEAAMNGEIINIPDAYADERFNPEVDRLTGFRTRSILAIPLLDYEDKLVGVAQVLNKDPEHADHFTTEDEATASHLAAQAAVALKRAALLESQRIREKFEADLAIAQRIQQASLPALTPDIPGYAITARTRPADQTGGDTYDLIPLEHVENSRTNPHAPHNPASPGSALVFMADATGHGIGPALSVTQAVSMLRMACRLSASISIIARHINEQLHHDLPAGRFITAFLGILDPGTNLLRFISAGQAPLILIRADNPADPLVLGATTMPLGIDDEADMTSGEPIAFRPGDLFLLLSDGYYEAGDHEGDDFGTQRIIDVATRNAHQPPRAILDALDHAVAEHCKGRPPDDDQTAIIIKRDPAD